MIVKTLMIYFTKIFIFTRLIFHRVEYWKIVRYKSQQTKMIMIIFIFLRSSNRYVYKQYGKNNVRECYLQDRQYRILMISHKQWRSIIKQITQVHFFQYNPTMFTYRKSNHKMILIGLKIKILLMGVRQT